MKTALSEVKEEMKKTEAGHIVNTERAKCNGKEEEEEKEEDRRRGGGGGGGREE